MPSDKTFPTKTGFCHILPDKIILTRDGVIGHIAQVTVGNGMARILIIYAALTIWIFYNSYHSYQSEEFVKSILLLVLGLAVGYVTISSLNNSATPIIER